MKGVKNHLRLMAACVGLWCAASCCTAADLPILVIDTKALTLTLLSAYHRPIARFRNIALGRGGVADWHLAGDATTPRGRFRVAWVNQRSRFGIFFGLDYPTPGIAARALAAGAIDRDQFDAILAAHHAGRLPPQDTPLGGQIGIHGLGGGDPSVQQLVNWTDGCVALSNADAAALGKWVQPGMMVEIR